MYWRNKPASYWLQLWRWETMTILESFHLRAVLSASCDCTTGASCFVCLPYERTRPDRSIPDSDLGRESRSRPGTRPFQIRFSICAVTTNGHADAVLFECSANDSNLSPRSGWPSSWTVTLVGSAAMIAKHGLFVGVLILVGPKPKRNTKKRQYEIASQLINHL